MLNEIARLHVVSHDTATTHTVPVIELAAHDVVAETDRGMNHKTYGCEKNILLSNDE